QSGVRLASRAPSCLVWLATWAQYRTPRRPCRAPRSSGGPERRRRPRGARHRAAERGDEDRVLALGVGREESNDLAVVEREAGGAEALRVGAQVEPPADDPGLEVGHAITAIVRSRQDALHVGEEEHGDGGGPAEGLIEAKEGGVGAKVSGLER